MLVFVALPCCVIAMASTAAWLKWYGAGTRAALTDSADAVHAAADATMAMLSYDPDTVDEDLVVVRDRLTGSFRDAYSSLADDVVIPGAREQRISSTATVAAASLLAVAEYHAVVLVFVDQTTAFGSDPPIDTASSVTVTVDKIDNRWLISDFTPMQP